MAGNLEIVILSVLQKLLKAIGTELSDSEGLLISKIVDTNPDTLDDLRAFASSPEARLAIIRLRNDPEVIRSLTLDQNACNRICQSLPLMQGFLISDTHSPISVGMSDLNDDCFYLWHNSQNLWRSMLSYPEGVSFFTQLVGEAWPYLTRYVRGGFVNGFSATLANNFADHYDAYGNRTDTLLSVRTRSLSGALQTVVPLNRVNLLCASLFGKTPSAQVVKYGNNSGFWGLFEYATAAAPFITALKAQGESGWPLGKLLVGWAPAGPCGSQEHYSREGAFVHMSIPTVAQDIRFYGNGFGKAFTSRTSGAALVVKAMGADPDISNWILHQPAHGGWSGTAAQAWEAVPVYGQPRIMVDLFQFVTDESQNTNAFSTAANNLLGRPTKNFLLLMSQEAFVREFFSFCQKQSITWTNKWNTPGMIVISNATPVEREFNRSMVYQRAIAYSQVAFDYMWGKPANTINEPTYAQGANNNQRRYMAILPVPTQGMFRATIVAELAASYPARFAQIANLDWQNTFWAHLKYQMAATPLRFEMVGGLIDIFSQALFIVAIKAKQDLLDYLLSECTAYSVPASTTNFPGVLAANLFGFCVLGSYVTAVNASTLNVLNIQGGQPEPAAIPATGSAGAPTRRFTVHAHASASSVVGAGTAGTFVLLGIPL